MGSMCILAPAQSMGQEGTTLLSPRRTMLAGMMLSGSCRLLRGLLGTILLVWQSSQGGCCWVNLPVGVGTGGRTVDCVAEASRYER